MDRRSVLRGQYAFAHEMLEGTIKKCPLELLTKSIEGSLTNPIGATYAHAVITEDLLLVRWLQNREPVFEEGNWGAKVGMELPQSAMVTPEWAKSVRFELEPMRAYAAAVRATVDGFIDRAPDSDLLSEVDFGPSKQPKLSVLGTLGVLHVSSHQGEMAALLGLKGITGQTV